MGRDYKEGGLAFGNLRELVVVGWGEVLWGVRGNTPWDERGGIAYTEASDRRFMAQDAGTIPAPFDTATGNKPSITPTKSR
jgi:hypothetical protein